MTTAREQAREAAREAFNAAFRANYENDSLNETNAVDGVVSAADAASDVWEPLVRRLARMVGQSTLIDHADLDDLEFWVDIWRTYVKENDGSKS